MHETMAINFTNKQRPSSRQRIYILLSAAAALLMVQWQIHRYVSYVHDASLSKIDGDFATMSYFEGAVKRPLVSKRTSTNEVEKSDGVPKDVAHEANQNDLLRVGVKSTTANKDGISATNGANRLRATTNSTKGLTDESSLESLTEETTQHELKSTNLPVKGTHPAAANNNVGQSTAPEVTSIRHVFQYGPPRTASTTQFNLVCVALFLHIKKYSPDQLNNTICTMAGSFTNDDLAYKYTLQQSNIPQAVKSHVNEPDPRQIKENTFVFATTKDAEEANRTIVMLHEKRLNVGIIQDFETFKTRGIDHWLKVYADFFSLSSEDVKLMSEYFSVWDKLRQCCGMQMSKNFRNDLLPSDKKNPEIVSHTFCGLIDPDAIERAFMNTKLYKLIDKHKLMRRMNRPATVDGDLDGTYCSRYNQAVRANGITPDTLIHSGLNSRYQSVQNHWNEELSDPFIGVKHLVNEGKCDGNKYIFFTAVNGFSNQLKGIEIAMRIAYSTNRTLIMPPLLPHKMAKPYGEFEGRDDFKISFDADVFTLPVNFSLGDVEKVQSLSSRTDFPAWSEVLDFDDLTNKTDVKLIDLYDFVKSNSNECAYEFFNQPHPPVPIVVLTNRSKTWADFIDLFEKQYDEHSIALLGNAFLLDHNADDRIFDPHVQLLEAQDPNLFRRISEGIQSLPLSVKVVDLLESALSLLPIRYTAVHLRTGDKPAEKIQTCTDEAIVSEYDKVAQSLHRSNVKEGSTIYIASNDGKARECFNNITNFKYKLVNLDDIIHADSSALEPEMKEIMSNIRVDLGTKYLLLDLLLVSMASEVHYAMINFEEGYNLSSFQELIKILHEGRQKRLRQMKMSEMLIF